MTKITTVDWQYLSQYLMCLQYCKQSCC